MWFNSFRIMFSLNLGKRDGIIKISDVVTFKLLRTLSMVTEDKREEPHFKFYGNRDICVFGYD